ncbi:MAG: YraN family protein, partial [Actinomycetes bacterium]
MNARQTLGRAAEDAAARHLQERGWRLLARNVRIGRGELDIIA